MGFVHLHVHTEYSLLDGAARIDEVFKRAKSLGMDAVAITDHGNMFGTLRFAQAAKKNKMKGIIGCEMYATDDLTSRNGKLGDDEHLVLLAKNREGYKHLCRLNSISYIDGFYYKPRIDYKTLATLSGGLICLSACLSGRIPRRLLKGDYAGAKEAALMLKGIFGEDFYLEIQDQGMEEEARIIPLMIKLSNETGIPLVATNDVHYISREDASFQDVLMCINTKTTIEDQKRMKMPSDEFYLKSPEEMAKLFSYVPEAVENTLKVAEKCGEVFNLSEKGDPVRDNSLIPGFTPPDGLTPRQYLEKLIAAGIAKKYGKSNAAIDERVKYELDIIDGMHYCEYFLIVWDFINYARSQGIPVGPGRGSGASSIVAYTIGITDVEPLSQGLFFERFLNPARVSMPDFDIDFCFERRQDVIEYVRGKYGAGNVAQIVTFGTLKSRAAVKDVGRVYNVPFGEVNRVTKIIGNSVFTLDQLLGFSLDKDGESHFMKELKEAYDSDPEIQRMMDVARKVQGMPRNTSKHAAGVVICRKVLADEVPLSMSKGDITTQYTMNEVEPLGFLKMDFLGLITLTDIDKTLRYIKENRGEEIDFALVGYHDPGAYQLISEGDTAAVFQLENPGMRKFMMQLKPNRLEDIIAGISLYRPGPMDSIPIYLKCRADARNIHYKTETLIPVLEETYGVFTYQEQVINACKTVAGFTAGQADVVRKVMSKKKKEQMDVQRHNFIYGREAKGDNDPEIAGAIKRGVPEAVATDIFDDMAKFAGYGFNKPHAACYAVLAYRTAYLKKHYPQEFLAAILNDRITKIDETSHYITYLKERGIPVLPPDINESGPYFAARGDAIRFGLAAIRGVGVGVINSIIEERERGGKYESFEDYVMRSDPRSLNKRMVENMIYGGVFDAFNVRRSQLIACYAELIERSVMRSKQKESNQFSLFDALIEEKTETYQYPNLREFEDKFKLGKEKESLGVYLSGHPLEKYKDEFKKLGFSTEVLQYYDEDEDGERTYTSIEDDTFVTMGGIITKVEKKSTKRGDNMCSVRLEDAYGYIEAVFFPSAYDKYKSEIIEDSIVIVSGKISVSDGAPSIKVSKMETYEDESKKDDEADEDKSPKEALAIRITADQEAAVIEALSFYPGDMEVFVKKDGKSYKLNCKVRKCEALVAELRVVVDEQNIVFYTRK